jgi:hypothetical protein
LSVLFVYGQEEILFPLEKKAYLWMPEDWVKGTIFRLLRESGKRMVENI